MKKELKCCPFCGGKAEKKTGNDNFVLSGRVAYVEIGCPKCDIWFREYAGIDKNATEAAGEKWNRRSGK